MDTLTQQLGDWSQWGLVIEPSAGRGDFYHRIPVHETKKIGIDISPDHPDIKQCDFLTYLPPEHSQPILVVGNPPFGRVCSLARRFFKHASLWAHTIAFIVPRTFRRHSLQRSIDPRFHLIYDMDIPTKPCAFDPPIASKCCFQIWQKKDIPRAITTRETTHRDWTFLKWGDINKTTRQPTIPEDLNETTDFAIRAYGGKCGEIMSSMDGMGVLRPKSWHWIRASDSTMKTILMERFKTLDFTISKNTARQNSIGKGDLVRLYAQFKFE